MVDGGDSLYVKFWSNGHRWSEIADFEPIFARRASAVTPSEESSINTNRKSTTRFPMSLRWSWYVAPKPPPKGAQKCKTADFRLKSHFAWRKSATKFICVKTVSSKVVVCKAFIGLTNRAKMIGGGDPFYLKFWIKVTRWSDCMALAPPSDTTSAVLYVTCRSLVARDAVILLRVPCSETREQRGVHGASACHGRSPILQPIAG